MSNSEISTLATHQKSIPGDGVAVIDLSCYVAGKKINSDKVLEVRSPYDNRLVGTVKLANTLHVQDAIEAVLSKEKERRALTKYERYSILEKARNLFLERKEEFAQIISAESGLAIREARHETDRTQDVFLFAAIETFSNGYHGASSKFHRSQALSTHSSPFWRDQFVSGNTTCSPG